MYKKIIGENAGKVWKVLYSTTSHRSSFDEIQKATGLTDTELAAAIGWLAREDKLQIDNKTNGDNGKELSFYLMLNVYI